MGLYDDLQKDLKNAFETDLEDAYILFQITKVVTSVYDPNTGLVTNTDDAKDCYAINVRNEDGDILDMPESVSGLIFLVLDSDKPFVFANNQKITFEGSDYRITGVRTDPVKAAWELHCIAWK